MFFKNLINIFKKIQRKLGQNGQFYQKTEICVRESNGNSRMEKYNKNLKLKDKFNGRMDTAEIRLVNYKTVEENIHAEK